MLQRFGKSPLWFAAYEGEDTTPGGAGDDTTPGGAGDETVKDQAQLNAVLKREKEKYRKDREKLTKQLEELQGNVRLTAEQKEALESQIEELRTQTMTADERARHKETKLQKDFEAKLTAASDSSKQWESRYHDLRIGYEITQASSAHEVLPNSVPFVEAVLRNRTKLVPNVTEDGQPDGTFTAKVKFDDVDAKGKPIVLDLTVEETVKRMKELPDKYGNLFKGANNGGLGGGTGAPGKKANPAKMSTEEYLAARRKDPASVGL